MSCTHIAIGIVYDSRKDKLFVCLRPPGRNEGGKWEFPGGKLERGETVLQALKRELYEEVGIAAEFAHPLIQVEQDTVDGSVRLHAWVVDQWSGTAHGKEGQICEWVTRTGLRNRVMPEANAKIIDALELPPLYLITPDRPSYDEDFLQLTENLVNNGLRLLQFRSRQSTFSQHKDLVLELVQICNSRGCKLVYNGDIEQALAVGAHGIHLRRTDLMRTRRRPVGPGIRVSASCHTDEQIIHASRIGSDFCVVAPVHETASHPGVKGIGWERFGNIARESGMPVYALGGIKPAELHDANRNGAHGIAMISGIWDAADPVAALCSITGGLPAD